ncbi:hypothetical protein [Clostridium massiliamazoniense]|uniref:hypothetical protein n=1 Tax=Clostridium massiliamazoniense TaxID=1347366 RepID=UPI0006D81BAB|nr:hypothetical protein [Clostridium massiliamazoniense]
MESVEGIFVLIIYSLKIKVEFNNIMALNKINDSNIINDNNKEIDFFSIINLLRILNKIIFI